MKYSYLPPQARKPHANLRITAALLLSWAVALLLVFVLKRTLSQPPIKELAVYKKLDYANLIGTQCSIEGGKKYTEKKIAVVDAGSTGTRMVLYSFLLCGEALLKTTEQGRCEVEGGVSDLADNQKRLAGVFKKLLAHCEKVAGRKNKKETPLILKATAGLRLLDSRKQALVVDWLGRILGGSGFDVSSPAVAARGGGVSIMTGDDEAEYGWLAVNYLYGRLATAEKTPAGPLMTTIDFGGASVQVVIPITEEEHYPEANTTVRVGNKTHHAYRKSFLGFGYAQLRKKMEKYIHTRSDPENSLRETARNVFGVENGRITTKKRDVQFGLLRKIVSDFFSCETLFDRSIQDDIAAIPQRCGVVFGFSAINDLCDSLDLKTNATHSPEKIHAKVKHVCSAKSNTGLCFDGLAILYVLEKVGMEGLRRGRVWADHNISWTLGLALDTLENRF
ncbi:MAG: GDA1/CD39 nucleoside phosphatase family protein [Amphiamblys sp. WSBS2006]|nr:MAG: GDA1/CD39 nucleoside phosphatase family protein [Amphiamblys sp. WSBS2006]